MPSFPSDQDPREPYVPTRKGRSSTSKRVVQRIKDTVSFTASIGCFKDKAAAGLGEKLAPELREGETMPDFALTLELLARSVETAVGELDAADERYARQGTRNDYLADQCERVARLEVHPAAKKVRRSIDAVYGKQAGFRLHGIEGRVLRKPSRQRYQVKRMVKWLVDPSHDLPEPAVAGFHPNREAWLEELGPAFAKLEQMMDELAESRGHEQFLQGERERAMDAFDEHYGESLRLAERMFVSAGLPELVVKSLRDYSRWRMMTRWARNKRQARAETEAPASTRRAAGRRAAARDARGGRPGLLSAIRQNVSLWLRKSG